MAAVLRADMDAAACVPFDRIIDAILNLMPVAVSERWVDARENMAPAHTQACTEDGGIEAG